MPRSSDNAVIEHLKQILAADAAAPAGEGRKLPAAFRTRLETVVRGLETGETDTTVVETGRGRASKLSKTAHGTAQEWIRKVLDRLKELPPTDERESIYVAYGFPGGHRGALTHDRMAQLLALFPNASARQTSPAAQLPASWLEELARLKTETAGDEPPAPTTARGGKGRNRHQVRALADDLINRAYGYLTYALPRRDRDPLMREYGFTARRKPGRKGKDEADEA